MDNKINGLLKQEQSPDLESLHSSHHELTHSVTQESVEDQQYTRYSNGHKLLITVMCSLSGFLSPMSSLAYLPATPEIASAFNTTEELINVSNGVYCIVMALSPCVWSPISDSYGKKWPFLICLIFFVVPTVLVGAAQNLASFFVFRALTAFFGTAFFSIGASIIGDIYKPTERGNAMGYLLSGTQVGPAIGPLLGGIIVTYTSWRVIFYVLAGIGAIVLVLVIIWLPETSLETKLSIKLEEIKAETGKRPRFVWIPFNPLRIVLSLLHPNLFLVGFASCTIHFNMYSLLTPIRAVIDPRFSLTSPIYGSLFYLAPGMGYLIGSFFGGKYADYYVRKYIAKRGHRIPEDRLRSTLVAFGIVSPGCMLIYGWCLRYEKGGMPVPILAMFFQGFSQTILFPAINTYCVDSMPQLKSDAVGGNYFVRFIAAAVGTSFVLTSIKGIGIGWTSTISACLLWCGCGCVSLLIWRGEKLRLNSLKSFGYIS